MMAVYDDGHYRFTFEIVKGSIRWPRVIRCAGVTAVLETAQPMRDGGQLFSFWLEGGLGFRMASHDLHEVDSPDSDFTVLGMSNDN